MTCRIEVSRRPHEELRLELMRLGTAMNSAAHDPAVFAEAHTRLAAFCSQELLPHLQRDEKWLTSAEQCSEARLLATAMRAEARAMTGAVQELAEAVEWVDAVVAARVVHALLAAHINHANLLATAVADSVGAGPWQGSARVETGKRDSSRLDRLPAHASPHRDRYARRGTQHDDPR